jgi:hypothetical protein
VKPDGGVRGEYANPMTLVIKIEAAQTNDVRAARHFSVTPAWRRPVR